MKMTSGIREDGAAESHFTDVQDNRTLLCCGKANTHRSLPSCDTGEQPELTKAQQKRAIIKNACVVSIAFLLVFSAFQSLTRLQSSLHRDRGMGTICQSVMYSALVASCLVMPDIIIHAVGLKWTMLFSFLGYIVWFVANGYAVWGTMVTASIIMGLSAGPLWTAQSTYFTILALKYAELTGQEKAAVLSKFFGIFFTFLQVAGVIGSVITTVVLLPTVNSTVLDLDTEKLTCGARDCPWADAITGHLTSPDKITMWILLGIFLLLAVMAVFITYYFVEDMPCSVVEEEYSVDYESPSEKREPQVHIPCNPGTEVKKFLNKSSTICRDSQLSIHNLQLFESTECVYPSDILTEQLSAPTEQNKNASCYKSDTFRKLFSTLRHLKNTEQLLLLPISFYMGLEQGTSAANFTKSFIACSIGIAKIGLVYIAYSAVNGLASFVSGKIVKYTGRFPVFTAAFIGDLAVQSTLQLWHPDVSEQFVLYILAGMWGLTDGIWHTQVNALYGAIFTKDSAAAFSNLRLWKAFGAITAFSYSSVLCTSVKVYILSGLLLVSMVGYYIVEFLQKNRRKNNIEIRESIS